MHTLEGFLSSPAATYAGCVCTGLVVAGSVAFGAKNVYRKLDGVENWSPLKDALVPAIIWAVAVLLLAGGAGAVYGWRSEQVYHGDFIVGWLHAVVGGTLAPWVFEDLRTGLRRGLTRLLATIGAGEKS